MAGKATMRILLSISNPILIQKLKQEIYCITNTLLSRICFLGGCPNCPPVQYPSATRTSSSAKSCRQYARTKDIRFAIWALNS